jgi:hypothetical protein
MLFSSDSFRAYDTILLGENFDYVNFKPGLYGLKLSELRKAPGLGAATIVALADIFSIPDDVEVLKFSLDKEMQVKYCLSPSFKLDKNEDGDNELYFIMGDWRLDLGTTCQTVIKEAKFLIDFAVFSVPQSDGTNKQFAGFSFNLNPEKPSANDSTKLIRAKDSNKVFDFILSFARDPEDSREQLVNIFNSASGDLEELYETLINSPYVGKVGEAFQFAQLKELPIGAYEVSEIEWEEKEITKKDTGEKARIQNWRFKAVSLTDKSIYYVNASKGSFFGKSITNTGDNISPVLNQAGKGKGGHVLLTLEALEKVANGISPKGRVFSNLVAGQAYIKARLPQLLAAELQAPANAPALKSAEPATA